MTEALRHRGPDDGEVALVSSAHAGAVVGFGNRRLAILDLSSAGHQPMFDEGRRTAITLNGEVYNFRELRADLEQRGFRFRTSGDTEVVLYSYRHYRAAAVERWRGMFGCAIWDEEQRRLILFRDRLGIKPLYYWQSPDLLLFSSELRSLLASGLIPRRLNPAALSSFLMFGTPHEPTAMIDGVRQVPPGHTLTWKEGRVRIDRYWDFPEPEPRRGINSRHDTAELHEQLRTELTEAVRLRLVSDVPLGAFLSGGIDSSAIVGLLTGLSSTPKTFSLVFEDDALNEAPYSRAVARQFGTDHTETLVGSDDVIDMVPKALAAMDQPTIDGVNTYVVSRAAKAAGVTVALSGLGGDEVFGGYKTFRRVPHLERLQALLALAGRRPRSIVGRAVGSVARTDGQRKLADLIESDPRCRLHPYFFARMLFPSAEARSLIGTDEIGHGLGGEIDDHLNILARQASRYDPITRVSVLEMRSYMANMLLRDTDVMSMAHSLEVRVPLIDHRVVERVVALPGKLKLRNDLPKPLLVESLHPILASEIVNRPKGTFTFPFDAWLRGKLRPTVEEILLSPCQPLAGYLQEESVRLIWRSFLDGRTSWTRPWSLYVLKHWAHRQLR